MTLISKLSMVSVLALLIAAPAAAAQLSATEGDYYAPTNTVVQQPSAQELKQVQQGDYYAPTNDTDVVSAARSVAIEKCTQQANAELAQHLEQLTKQTKQVAPPKRKQKK